MQLNAPHYNSDTLPLPFAVLAPWPQLEVPSDLTKTDSPCSIAPGPSAEQTLENIKMAYYWAGYYSGLYDGQRQAQASAPPPPPPQP